MKNLYLINHYAQEPGGAGGTRHFHLAEHLQKRGWKATVIAASVDHATGLQRLTQHEAQRLQSFGSVPFLWVKTPTYTGNSGGRMRNMLAFTWRVLLRKTTANLSAPDVVIGSSVHPFAAVAGALLARRHDVPFVFEVRDLWPQTLIDMGRLKSDSFTAWALRKVEFWLYRRAARVVVLLPQAWQYIVPLGIPKQNVVWIPNGVDLGLFPAPAAPMPSNVFTLMYFGAHGQANGLDNVLHAMKVVQDDPTGQQVLLRMVGDGPLKPALMAQAQALGLRNVRFESPVPKSQIPALAAQADAFAIAVLDLPQLYRYGISMNKIFDYLAASRPVVIASDAVNNPVADAQAGLSVEAGKPDQLAKAILQIAAMSAEERHQMGLAGRSYVERNHDFGQLAAKLADVLDEVCAEHMV